MSCPDAVSRIVVACCVLHNIGIRNAIELDVPEMMEYPREANVSDDEAYEEENGPNGARPQVRGTRARAEIVQAYFVE